MKVLVLTEDFRKDEYLAGPIVEVMLQHAGRPRAKVQVSKEFYGGVSQALDWDEIVRVLHRYEGMVDLYLLLVDRDGNVARRAALDALEAKAANVLPRSRKFLAEHAWQELEVWALAGQSLPKGWNIKDIRSHQHPKEAYFEPFAERRGLSDEPAGGRVTLGREAAANYKRIRSRCPEDVAALERRIKEWLDSIR